MDISKMHEDFKSCSCGKSHTCPIDEVIICHGAISQMPLLCDRYKKILLVCDENTDRVCAKKIEGEISDKIYKKLVLSDKSDVVIPNEEKIDEITSFLEDDCDLIIGAGSGVINDLCKYVSFKNSLPYFIVATAPSMDGYASVGAALILGGMKVTLNARPPKAIIADTEILKDAPMDMIKAGYGDIIGKYSCLNDWKLSALINGEYFCQKVYDLTYSCAQKVRDMAYGVKNRDEKTVGALMEALVTVGVAMSYVDCSRPASGSEHHLSHFFEITGILDKKEYFAHGIDVAFSAVATAELREKLLTLSPKRKTFCRKDWEDNIKRLYSTSASGVIALQDKLAWYEADHYEKVAPVINEIKKILSECPSRCEFIDMINAVGLDYAEFEKLYGKEKINDAILYSKDLKDRYSVLWLNYCCF